MGYQNFKFEGREICFGSLNEKLSIHMSEPFVALLPASDKAECIEAEKLIVELMDMGCVEFCCVGQEAELLHDKIDYVIEACGVTNIVTTFDADIHEACEYFLFGAGGGQGLLLAMISEHQDLVKILQEVALS